MKVSNLIYISILFVLSFSVQILAQESYPLLIRGSDDVKKLKMYIEGNEKNCTLVIKYRKGTVKANKNQPQGVGSWLDRPLNIDEPTTIRYSGFTKDVASGVIKYLKSSNCYYMFWCVNTGDGYFETTAFHAYVFSGSEIYPKAN